MQRATSEGTITVLVPLHAELARVTLGSIIRQSRLSPPLFEE
jgi:hypothetical protein